MHALLLIAALAGSPRPACPRVACTDECWEVRVTYRQVISAPGAPPEYVTAQAIVGGAWGSMAGARCHADQISREGFWRDDTEDVPTPGPAKMPAGVVDSLVVLERAFPATDSR